MSGRSDSTYSGDWLRVARKDWHRLLRMQADGDTEAAAYFLQQSLEKYLKAWLLHKGVKLKRTHELDELIAESARHLPSLASYEELCERVSGFYFSQRYPAMAEITVDATDLAADVEEAHALVLALYPHEQIATIPNGE